MIAFVAFGSGSIADALNLGGDAIVNLIPANFTSISQQQIIEIDDASFKPVQLITHVVENKTNPTNNTNSTNVTTPIT
jgi:hypothetical protein